MKNVFGFAVTCVTLLTASSVGLGYTFDDVIVAEWASSSAGADDNTAICVIDFGAGVGAGDSYAFGYKWENGETFTREQSKFADDFGYVVDTKMGEAMMLALNAQTGLNVGYNYHNLYGFFVDSLSYDGKAAGLSGYPGDWLSYWNSTDGETWTDAPVGVSDRSLSDGDWDGWGRETSENWPPTASPSTPVPEPMTITIFALGALGLVRTPKRPGKGE